MKTVFLQVFLLCIFLNPSFATEIDTVQSVQIGGIQQVLSIQGQEINNPILLYLHGGPGQAASARKAQITGRLEEHFVVVHWDQRAAGQTLGLNAEQGKLSLDQMKKDAEEVLHYLLQNFQREKIHLLAHSWGSVLGFHLAEKHPQKIAHFFALSPSVNATKSQQIALDILKKHFKEKANEKARQQLASIKIPHADIEDMIIQYRWQSVYDGEKVTDEMIQQYMPFFQDWEKKWMPLYQELYARNLSTQLPALDCPVYFLIGKKDYNANFSLSEAYFKELKAPVKKLFWFDTGHNIPKEAPDQMQEIIIEQVVRK